MSQRCTSFLPGVLIYYQGTPIHALEHHRWPFLVGDDVLGLFYQTCRPIIEHTDFRAVFHKVEVDWKGFKKTESI